jgi:peptidoglycan lytic transglycosylase D
VLHIINNPEKYGLDSISLDPPLKFEVVPVSKQIHLRNIAKIIGTTETMLCELNPELRYRILPPEKYPLKVPPGKGELLLANLDSIPVSSPPQLAYVYHRVRFGESLSTIASKYRTSVKSIVRANNIHKQNFIVAGQKLKIPRKGAVVYRSTKYDQPVRERPAIHVVKSGDSLWILAKRYDTTTQKIQEANDLQTTNLYIGQSLKIPGESEEDQESGQTLKTYEVKRGDSPFQIAEHYKMPLEKFLRINRLTPRSTIFPGQRLYVE